LAGLQECFTPNVSLESKTTRKQLFENMLALEVFANLRGEAIDETVGRAKGPVTVLRLTVEEDVVFLSEFIRQKADNICLIHFAPPCGTRSATSKRRLPQHFWTDWQEMELHHRRFCGQKPYQWAYQI
jgi:hypothetical protein